MMKKWHIKFQKYFRSKMDREIRQTIKQGININNYAYEIYPTQNKIQKIPNSAQFGCFANNCIISEPYKRNNSLEGESIIAKQTVTKNFNKNILIHKVAAKPNVQIQTTKVYTKDGQIFPVYLNQQQAKKGSLSPQQVRRNAIPFSASPKMLLMQQPNMNYNNTILNRRVNEKSISPQMRNLSPVYINQSFQKPKVTIRYLSPPQLRTGSFSPYNQKSLITSLNSQRQICTTEPRVPNILRRIYKTVASKEKNEVTLSRPVVLRKTNSESYNNISSQNAYAINIIGAPLLKSQQYGIKATKQSLKSTQWTTEVGHGIDSDQKIMKAHESIIETSSKNMTGEKKQIHINGDKFSQQDISDRSISDDVQL